MYRRAQDYQELDPSFFVVVNSHLDIVVLQLLTHHHFYVFLKTSIRKFESSESVTITEFVCIL